MLLEYIGPHIDGVAVPYGLGEILCPHGEPVDIPDDVAAGLLDQPTNWRVAATKPRAGEKEVTADES